MYKVGGGWHKTINWDDSRYYGQKIIDFSNYRVKILLDLAQILQIAFFLIIMELKIYLI